MNVLDLFRTLVLSRRSLREYQDTAISEAVIQDLLTIATWAPSAHNRQPWRFAVVRDPDKRSKLAQQMGDQLRKDLGADGVDKATIEKDVQRSYQRITSAPVVICMCITMQDMDEYPDERRQQQERIMAIQSGAMAGQNLLLAAHAAGLGACWMCAPLFCPHVVREALELPTDWEPQGLITLGYPAQQREKSRHPLETRTLWR